MKKTFEKVKALYKGLSAGKKACLFLSSFIYAVLGIIYLVQPEPLKTYMMIIIKEVPSTMVLAGFTADEMDYICSKRLQRNRSDRRAYAAWKMQVFASIVKLALVTILASSLQQWLMTQNEENCMFICVIIIAHAISSHVNMMSSLYGAIVKKGQEASARYKKIFRVSAFKNAVIIGLAAGMLSFLPLAVSSQLAILNLFLLIMKVTSKEPQNAVIGKTNPTGKDCVSLLKNLKKLFKCK